MQTTQNTLTKPSMHSQSLKVNAVYKMVAPIMDTKAIVDWWKEYQDLKSQLLQPSDYQEIQGKMYIKKSGFRKLATAFWISIEITKEERVDIKDYFVYELTAKAIAPNGRFTTACASCASNERKFSHTENDVRATAQTRSVNRAISDLIWGWEVSADEMQSIRSGIGQHNSHKNEENAYNSGFSQTSSRFNIVHQIPNWWSSQITHAQKKLLIRLIERKYHDEQTRSAMFKELNTMSKFDASKSITKLIR